MMLWLSLMVAAAFAFHSPSPPSAPSPTFSGDKAWVVQGRPGSGCGSPSCTTRKVAVEETHALRCCADFKLNDQFMQNTGCSVWHNSYFGSVNVWQNSSPNHRGCVQRLVTYAEGKQFCENMGARVCTKAEVEAKCVVGSGCGADALTIWADEEQSYTDDFCNLFNANAVACRDSKECYFNPETWVCGKIEWTLAISINENNSAFQFYGSAWSANGPYTNGKNSVTEAYSGVPVNKIRIEMNGVQRDFNLGSWERGMTLKELFTGSRTARDTPAGNPQDRPDTYIHKFGSDTFAVDANLFNFYAYSQAKYYCFDKLVFGAYRKTGKTRWIAGRMGFLRSPNTSCSSPSSFEGVGIIDMASGENVWGYPPVKTFSAVKVWVLPAEF